MVRIVQPPRPGAEPAGKVIARGSGRLAVGLVRLSWWAALLLGRYGIPLFLVYLGWRFVKAVFSLRNMLSFAHLLFVAAMVTFVLVLVEHMLKDLLRERRESQPGEGA